MEEENKKEKKPAQQANNMMRYDGIARMLV